MSFLARHIQAWRYGQTGITGLGQMQNQLKMFIVVLAPFLALWFPSIWAISNGYIPKEIAGVVMICVMGAWGLICGFYSVYIKNDANNYKVCPQTPTYMPDGTEKKFTFKIEPEGLMKIPNCEFKDGSIGVKVRFKDRYLYRDKRLDFPFVFREGYWKLPAELGESFKFMSEGEFWHGGMIVSTSNCEHISWYVREIVQEKGVFFPVGVIGDCSHRHRDFMSGNGELEAPVMSNKEKSELLYKAALQREGEATRYAETLEQRIEEHETHARKYKDSVSKGFNTIFGAIHTWEEVELPLVKRIVTWKNIVYAVLLIGGIFAFLYFFGMIK